MIDRFERTIDYLRVSVTDRCNFRCIYCMPEAGAEVSPKNHLLSVDELVRLVRIASDLGIRKVRLTGGEPLVRKDLDSLVRELTRHAAIDDLSLTTNGYLLADQAQRLRQAGLHRVNVSLDTLRPERFHSIARRGDLDRVLQGIEAALEFGVSPLKINVVAMRGVNDDEVVSFAEWTLRQEIHVRFIELMPVRWNLDESYGFETWRAHGDRGLLQLRTTSTGMLDDRQMRRMMISADELKRSIETEFGPLEEAEITTNGPARSYRIPGAPGTVGFISQISNDLCRRCNRLRLTADGFLRPCLMSDGELDLRTPLRQGATEADLAALFRHVVERKPERHFLAEGQHVTARGMSQLGG